MIDDATVSLVKSAVAIARGDAERLRTWLGAARAFAVPKSWIEELLLQSFLNVGYPLTLAAWEVWRGMAGPYEPAGEPLDHAQWRDWQSQVATVDAPRQLRAHLQGALTVGWTREQIDLALAMVEEQVSKERAVKIWEGWAEIRSDER